jgi:hypothetical protein
MKDVPTEDRIEKALNAETVRFGKMLALAVSLIIAAMGAMISMAGLHH